MPNNINAAPQLPRLAVTSGFNTGDELRLSVRFKDIDAAAADVFISTTSLTLSFEFSCQDGSSGKTGSSASSGAAGGTTRTATIEPPTQNADDPAYWGPVQRLTFVYTITEDDVASKIRIIKISDPGKTYYQQIVDIDKITNIRVFAPATFNLTVNGGCGSSSSAANSSSSSSAVGLQPLSSSSRRLSSSSSSSSRPLSSSSSSSRRLSSSSSSSMRPPSSSSSSSRYFSSSSSSSRVVVAMSSSSSSRVNSSSSSIAPSGSSSKSSSSAIRAAVSSLSSSSRRVSSSSRGVSSSASAAPPPKCCNADLGSCLLPPGWKFNSPAGNYPRCLTVIPESNATDLICVPWLAPLTQEDCETSGLFGIYYPSGEDCTLGNWTCFDSVTKNRCDELGGTHEICRSSSSSSRGSLSSLASSAAPSSSSRRAVSSGVSSSSAILAPSSSSRQVAVSSSSRSSAIFASSASSRQVATSSSSRSSTPATRSSSSRRVITSSSSLFTRSSRLLSSASSRRATTSSTSSRQTTASSAVSSLSLTARRSSASSLRPATASSSSKRVFFSSSSSRPAPNAPTVAISNATQNCAKTSAIALVITPAATGTPATSYVFQYTYNNGTTWSSGTQITGTQTTVNDLQAKTAIKFRVAAKNSAIANQSAWAESNTVTTTSNAPLPPTSLAQGNKTLTANGATVLITWNKPAQTANNSATTKFELTISKADASNAFAPIPGMPANITPANTTAQQYTTGELQPGAYRISVVSADAAGCKSDPVTTDFTIDAIVLPGAPTNLTATRGTNGINLSWTAPAKTGNAAITDYLVQHARAAAGPWTTFNDGKSAATTATISGLTNGITYYFRVAAINAAGAGPFSNTASARMGAVPAAPTWENPGATAGNQQVTLAWIKPNDNGFPITGYTVKYTQAGNTQGITIGAASSPKTVVNLVNGTNYSFSVAATNEVGLGPYSAAISATPGILPTAPQNLNGSVSGQAINASWSPPANSLALAAGNIPNTSYTLQYKEATATFWPEIQGIPGPNASIPGLVTGKSYNLRVAAQNVIGIGPYSAAITVTVSAAPATPNAPIIVITGDNTITIGWNAPADNGSAITQYNTQYRLSTSLTWINGPSLNALSVTVDQLTNGLLYVFRVRAVNVIGAGPWSPPSTSAKPGGVPSPPRNLAKTCAATSCALLWLPPLDNGGFVVGRYGYVIQYKAENTTAWREISSADSGRIIRPPQIVAGVLYTVRVLAVNVIGRSGPSNEITLQIFNNSVPGQIVGLSAAPEESCTADTTAGIELIIPRPANAGPPILDYTVQYGVRTSLTSIAPITWISMAAVPPAAVGNTTLMFNAAKGAQSGKIYVFRVRARNSVGPAAWSFQTSASMPSITSANNFAVSARPPAAWWDSYNLTWTSPVGSRRFQIYESKKAGESQPPWECDFCYNKLAVTPRSGGPQTMAIGRKPAGIRGTYTYYVKETISAPESIGGADCETWSSPVLIDFNPATVPSQPLAVVAVAGNAKAKLTWRAPASDGGSPITAYTVYYSLNTATNSQKNWIPILFFINDTSADIEGLANNTAYVFGVSASNEIGEGPIAASNVVTPTATAEQPPGPPSNLTCAPGDTAVRLQWNAPTDTGGSAITRYLVEYASFTDGIWRVAGNPTARAITVSNLVNNTQYSFRVAAVNANGTGDYTFTDCTPTGGSGGGGEVVRISANAFFTINRHLCLNWSVLNPTTTFRINGFRVLYFGGGLSGGSGFLLSADRDVCLSDNFALGTSYSVSLQVQYAGSDGWSNIAEGSFLPICCPQ